MYPEETLTDKHVQNKKKSIIHEEQCINDPYTLPGRMLPLFDFLYQVRTSLPKTLSPRHTIVKKRPSLMENVGPRLLPSRSTMNNSGRTI